MANCPPGGCTKHLFMTPNLASWVPGSRCHNRRPRNKSIKQICVLCAHCRCRVAVENRAHFHEAPQPLEAGVVNWLDCAFGGHAPPFGRFWRSPWGHAIVLYYEMLTFDKFAGLPPPPTKNQNPKSIRCVGGGGGAAPPEGVLATLPKLHLPPPLSLNQRR